jgi:hypothetical protein
MPGAPLRASTSRPESSARAHFPVWRAISIAFLRALAEKVSPSSTTSGKVGKLDDGDGRSA